MFHRLTLHSFFAACCLVATPVHARTRGFQDVLSAVTLLLSQGPAARAVLVRNKYAADLYLYLAEGGDLDRDAGLTLVLTKKSIAFSGSMAGQLPWLEVSANGSLLVKSGNESVGRNRWSQTLTVIYRNKEFVIAGIKYAERDTLDPGKDASCDLDLLTGKGQRNGKPLDVKLAPIPLVGWSDQKLPKECHN